MMRGYGAVITPPYPVNVNWVDIRLAEYGIRVRMSPSVKLTRLEQELLQWLLEGKTVTDIATQRHRCVKTVSTQKYRLYKKLGIKNDLTLWRDIWFLYHPEVILDGTKPPA